MYDVSARQTNILLKIYAAAKGSVYNKKCL